MNITINKLAESQIKALKYDTEAYGCKIEDLHKLILLKNGLQNFDCQELNAEKNCCKSECGSKRKERLSIIEATRPITLQYTKNSKTTKARVLSDNQDEFFRKNPFAATYELWERIARGICLDFNIKVTNKKVTKAQCDLALEISMKTFKPDCLIVLQAVKHIQDNCDEIKICRTKSQCKIDWKLLVEKHKQSCDLTLKDYNKLVEAGITYDVLDILYQNDKQIVFKDGRVLIKSIMSTVSLDDLECFSPSAFGENRELLREVFKDIILTDLQREELGIGN